MELGQCMLSKGYMYHVSGDHQFEDAPFWYVFDDELIEKVKDNLDENMVDALYVKRSTLTRKQTMKMAIFQHYRLQKHNELVQYLVTMTVTPEEELGVLLDVQKAFHLPDQQNHGQFVCKVIDNVSYATMIEAVQFILTELWEQSYAQSIYSELVGMLTLTQKAKLFSIGADRKNRSYHFKVGTLSFLFSFLLPFSACRRCRNIQIASSRRKGSNG